MQPITGLSLNQPMENGHSQENDVIDGEVPQHQEIFTPPPITTDKWKPETQHDLVIKISNQTAPTELKYEAGLYILGEYGELLDFVNDNVKRSFIDKKSTSKIPSVIYSSTSSNAALLFEFKVAFHLLPEATKFLFVTMRSSKGTNSFTKGEPSMDVHMSQSDKNLWNYSKHITGQQTCHIVGFFDCTEREGESTWEFTRLDVKTNFESIQEALAKFHHELLTKALADKKELQESYNKPYKYFKIRRGHEIPIKNKQVKISIDSLLLGEEFDIDLTVLFYNDGGHLINYCYGDIEEPFGSEKKILTSANPLMEPTKSNFWVDLTKLDRIEWKRKKDEVSITNVKSMVFALTIYEPNSYNFLWVSETKVKVSDGSTEKGEEVFTMTCQQSFLTSVILCMLYKDDNGKWMFRALDEAKRANHFVELLDGLRQDYVPRKPLVGVQEMAVAGNLDKMDVDQDQLINIKIRHNTYKGENIDRLNLIVYDNRGFVIKFLDQIPMEKDPFGCLDYWIRFDMSPFVQNRDENWTIVGVLTGVFPTGTDLALEFYDLEKKKVHFQMALETRLYLETDMEDENHFYSCIPFQMIQKPKEGGVKLWTIKAEGICTSQNKPVQWFPFLKNHIIRDLLGRRNFGLSIQKRCEQKLDSLDHLTIGVQTKEGKVNVHVTPFDYALREYSDEVIGDGYSSKYRYTEYQTKGKTERDLITMYRQNDYYWYETDMMKNETSLPIPGEGDQCQIVINGFDKTFPFRMLQFGIYLTGDKSDKDLKREDIIIKVYGGSKPDENEILYTTTVRLSGDRNDPLEKEIFQGLKTATAANVFVPFVITRNNLHPENGEFVNGEKEWSLAFIYGRASNVKKHLENNDVTLEPNIPRQALKLVVETIGARGLFGGDVEDKSDSYCQGTIAGVTFSTSTRAQSCDPDWKDTHGVPILKEGWKKANLKIGCFESITKEGKKSTDPIPLGEFEIPSLSLIPQPNGQPYQFSLLPGDVKGKRTPSGYVLVNFKYNRDESINQ